MTAELSEIQLVELLHLPPARSRPESVAPRRAADPVRPPGLAGLAVLVEPSGPGRQGGPALALLGALFALAGIPLWLIGPAELGWTAATLVGLGLAQVVLGLRLAERGDRHRARAYVRDLDRTAVGLGMPGLGMPALRTPRGRPPKEPPSRTSAPARLVASRRVVARGD